jgi:3-methyladenine DNA glycosylase/8-oxoguanine DNA glycosylase
MVYDGKPVEVEVTQEGASGKPVLHVIATSERIVPGLKSALTHALERMLGLRIDLSKFYDFVKEEKKLYELSRRFLGLKPPRFFNRYEALANSFACQQLSLIVGIVLLNRLAMRCGLPFEKVGRRSILFPNQKGWRDFILEHSGRWVLAGGRAGRWRNCLRGGYLETGQSRKD